ncbi:sodium/hydrogen exchanger family protein [Alcanivorax hongdengensis A-11-3]|uniref:Sodium/hydrogen exchanger family protein n=1 Tax=Alcanivorax hongdengensis A-11-3 TaxID=1177179 RepID=L0WBY8_9GAMM|nr:potassium/proton antiporter [Alcanivorax hongdengensis]EKF73255.1 sodium/hydrogen exchanger family protein [Alcanivorax hongdengensis A-11-3]
MDSLNLFLLIGTGLMFTGLLLGSLSARFGVPALLIFLVVGMLAGEDGLGGIKFDDFSLAYVVGNIALAVILLDGGLRTQLSTFKLGLKPALSLATLGVAVSAALVGAFTTWLMDVDWRVGLLLGGIVGSTDAAAVFSVIKGAGVKLNERVASTLEIESGLNDPMAIFITLMLVGLLVDPQADWGLGMVVTLVKQFGLGALSGLLLGVVLSEVLLRVRSNEGLHALLLCSGGAMVFALTNLVGGSGFLAIYLTGLVAGNRRGGTGDNVLRSMDSMAWLAQSGMFLILGLLVTPSRLTDHLPQALAVAFFLMLLARPLSVWVSLLPFRFTWREKTFIAWTGLRGAVPIVLAVFPLLAGVGQTRLLFDITLVVVLISLLGQGASLRYMARRLKVSVPPSTEPKQTVPLAVPRDRYLMQFEVEGGAKAVGKPLSELGEDERTPLLLYRNRQVLGVGDNPTIEAGDMIAWLAPLAHKSALSDLCHQLSRDEKRYYGDFSVLGKTPVAQLVAIYGMEAPANLREGLTVTELFAQQVGKQAVVGDTVLVSGLKLRARSVQEGRVILAGLKLPG